MNKKNKTDFKQAVTINGKTYNLVDLDFKHEIWTYLTSKEKEISKRLRDLSYRRIKRVFETVDCDHCSNTYTRMKRPNSKEWRTNMCRSCLVKAGNQEWVRIDRKYEVKKLSKKYYYDKNIHTSI